MSHSFVKGRSNSACKPENTSWWSSQPAISKRCLCFVDVICQKAVYAQQLLPHFFSFLNSSEDPNLSMSSASSRLEQGQDWGGSVKGFTQAITKGSFRSGSELTGKKQPKTAGREDFFDSSSGFWRVARFACLDPFKMLQTGQHRAIQRAGEGAFLKITFSPWQQPRDMAGLAERRQKSLFRSPPCHADFVTIICCQYVLPK